jgi:hypothetical protein
LGLAREGLPLALCIYTSVQLRSRAVMRLKNGLPSGLKKEACAGLKTLYALRFAKAKGWGWGVTPHAPCRGMYLELRRRPMSREHARPRPPAGSRRYGGGAEEPAPVPVGVAGRRTQRPRGQVGPPGPHPAQPSSSLDPGGERWPIFRPLAPLIAQLVRVLLPQSSSAMRSIGGGVLRPLIPVATE